MSYVEIAPEAPLEFLLSQAQLESIISFRHLLAKKRAGDQDLSIHNVRLAIRREGWVVWGTDRYVAGFLEVSTDARTDIGENEEVVLHLGPDTLDLLKRRFITATPAARDRNWIAVTVHPNDSGSTESYQVEFKGGDIDGDMSLRLGKEGGAFPKLAALIPAEDNRGEISGFALSPDRLTPFTKLVMPQDVGVTKAHRSTDVQLDFTRPNSSGAQTVLVRFIAKNVWPDGIRFQGILMSRKNGGEFSA